MRTCVLESSKSVRSTLNSAFKQDRLEPLSSLFTEQETVSNVKLNTIVDEFTNLCE